MYYFFHTQGAHVWIGQQQAMRRFCALADATRLARYFCSFAGNRRRWVIWKAHNQRSPRLVGRTFPSRDPA